jgi:hypothetical protein
VAGEEEKCSTQKKIVVAHKDVQEAKLKTRGKNKENDSA